jgi:YVTN family beta-propeller protein
VANYTSNNVSVIDTATNAVVDTVAVGTIPYGVAVNPAGTRVYVANAGSNNVSVIDTATNAVVDTVAVGLTPFSLGLFIGPDTTPDTPDTTAPTTVASVSPAANEAGWNNVNVTVTLTATDNMGGSGVQSIYYTLSGAQIDAANVTGSAASALITAEGTTTVTYHARDVAGNVESDKTVVINLDKTVLSPAQAMTNLLAQVMSLGFQQGSSLLKNALSQLGRGNTTAACNQMGAFINQVRAQAGKQLTTAQAAELIQAATDIRGSLACS